MNRLAVLLLLIIPGISGAAVYEEMEICWKPPTHRENGDVLDPTEIIRHDMSYDIVIDTLDEFWFWNVTAGVNCIKFLPTTPDEVCFRGTTTATDNTNPVLELTSSLSNRVCRFPVEIRQPSAPKPPTIFIP